MRTLSRIRLLTYAMLVAIVISAGNERRLVPVSLGQFGLAGSGPLRAVPLARHARDDFVAERMTVEAAIKLAEEFARREGVKIGEVPITAATLRFKGDRPTWYIHYQLAAGSDPSYYTLMVDCRTGQVSTITYSPPINLPTL